MKKNIDKISKKEEVTRKEAIKKTENYGKYAALTALGTYLILNPKKVQTMSALADPDDGF